MRRLYFLQIDGRDGHIPDEMFLSLPGEKRERLLRFRSEIDRKLGAYSDILLRCLASKHQGVHFGAVDIRTGPSGKPYAAGCPRFEFSVSHTHSAIAAAISDEPVGVDIERVREIDTEIAGAIFSAGELALLNEERQNRCARFFEIWTRKEARIKRGGAGLPADLKACDVTASIPGEELFTTRAGPYVISVCAGTTFNERDIREMNGMDLEQFWRGCTGGLPATDWRMTNDEYR